MNLKQDFNSVRLKTTTFLAGVGLFSMLICLGSQRALANSETIFIVKAENILQSTITGTVTDSQGVPLAGASVLVKGTTSGTQTDFDGNYSISANANATLVVSYIGFVTQEVVVNGQASINIQLGEDTALLDEVVVIGYGTQKRKQ